ncbi:hypothetical protein Pla123a_18330 [Posidoniimonas polymericola]|uniref:VWFA domain-containing protein n=1 Tax=Posidoniimonas polymericola TaxID=2528002 RepID=A0A5C5YTH4_9BACT|nr:vWA domain-containing protein [Posidoniimonas polymericola]TWT78033.1 hypothetical protein Pla123a_18330 [Posidoniimonas polymericola]
MAEKARSWLRSAFGADELPIDAETGAWAISLGVHLLLMVVFAVAVFSLPGDNRVVLSSTPVDLDEETPPDEFRFSDELQDQIGALADAGSTNAEAAALIEALESEIVMPVEPLTAFGEVQAFEVEQPITQGPRVDDALLVQGVGSVGATGAEGAVDRITTEILLSLDNEPTLVVWLFDQSGSLRAQREQIARRFDRVYEELGVVKANGDSAFEKHEDKPLLTYVAQFGSRVAGLTPDPTDDLTEIKSAVRSVVEDDGGVENVFTAIGTLAQELRHYRLKRPRRNVMIVVFTDEAGDDVSRLDDAVAVCTKYQMPVYVVGVPAPFGREKSFVKYVHPDADRYDQTPIDVPVDQGPESLMPERIKLGFLGGDNGDPRANLDSGFGPFGLTRLAYQTGGAYFTVHPNRTVGRTVRRRDTAVMSPYITEFFDPRVMRRYRPDYVTVSEYRQNLVRMQDRGALVRAAARTWTAPMDQVRQVFEKVDEAEFAQALTLAQRDAAKLEPRLEELVQTLSAGERDRRKEESLRWQAGYDLAYGRALAAKVRTEGYNTMLAQAKQGMKFEQEKSDTWMIKPSDNISTGSVLSKQAQQATALLEGVVATHAGTPWAMLAERELSTPLGWEWSEAFRDVAARRERMAQNASRPPREPMNNLPPRKQPPPVPKL